MYLRGAHGVIIVYDITDQDSFDHINDWLREVDKSGNEKASKLIVGNKSDLASKREVDFVKGQELAQRLGIPFFETSVLDVKSVETAFSSFVAQIVRSLDLQHSVTAEPSGVESPSVKPSDPQADPAKLTEAEDAIFIGQAVVPPSGKPAPDPAPAAAAAAAASGETGAGSKSAFGDPP